MDKISVIILIYNVDQYLDKCIESVVKQTYQSLEILLVDDGSPDNSMQICERWAQADSRIKILYETNQGRGVARDLGITHATGDFITFVDGDDFVQPTYVEHLYQQHLKYDSDVAIMSLMQVDQQGRYYTLTWPYPGMDKFDRAYKPVEWINTGMQWNNVLPVGPVCKLIRRDLFSDIRFPVDRAAEDIMTTWKLYLAARRISFQNDVEYIYSINEQSATYQAGFKNIDNTFKAWTEELAVIALIRGSQSSTLEGRYADLINELSDAGQETSNYSRYYHANLLKQIMEKRCQ